MTTPPITKETVQAMLDAATPWPWAVENGDVISQANAATIALIRFDQEANAAAIASWPDLARAYLDLEKRHDDDRQELDRLTDQLASVTAERDSAHARGFALAIEAAVKALRRNGATFRTTAKGDIFSARDTLDAAEKAIRTLTTKTALTAALEVPEIAALVSAAQAQRNGPVGVSPDVSDALTTIAALGKTDMTDAPERVIINWNFADRDTAPKAVMSYISPLSDDVACPVEYTRTDIADARLAEKDAEIAQLRGLLWRILDEDERGQGLPYQEAMNRAAEYLGVPR